MSSSTYTLCIAGISKGTGWIYKKAREKAEFFGRRNYHTQVFSKHELVFEMRNGKITMDKSG